MAEAPRNDGRVPPVLIPLTAQEQMDDLLLEALGPPHDKETRKQIDRLKVERMLKRKKGRRRKRQ